MAENIGKIKSTVSLSFDVSRILEKMVAANKKANELKATLEEVKQLIHSLGAKRV